MKNDNKNGVIARSQLSENDFAMLSDQQPQWSYIFKIVGCVTVGLLLLFLVLACIVIFHLRRRRSQQEHRCKQPNSGVNVMGTYSSSPNSLGATPIYNGNSVQIQEATKLLRNYSALSSNPRPENHSSNTLSNGSHTINLLHMGSSTVTDPNASISNSTSLGTTCPVPKLDFQHTNLLSSCTSSNVGDQMKNGSIAVSTLPNPSQPTSLLQSGLGGSNMYTGTDVNTMNGMSKFHAIG